MTNPNAVVVADPKSSKAAAAINSAVAISNFFSVLPKPMFPVSDDVGPRVAASRRRKLLKQLDRQTNAYWVDSLRSSSPTGRFKCIQSDENQKPRMVHHPSALEKFEQITNDSKGKKIVIFLDYDGTLSPIVDDPDRAFMSDEMRTAVREVAKHFPTAIVTGRCMDKVYSFIKLSELYYAGSHGMDIKGPAKPGTGMYNNKGDNKSTICRPAIEFLPMIDQVYKALVEKTKCIPGAFVENNKFCASVHFRRVNEERWDELAEEVRRVVSEYPKLKLSQGRKVLEIRPTIKWDKGKAVEFLLESLGYGAADDSDDDAVLPIYIGDDRSDEDAFKVLRNRRNHQGLGILVSKAAKETNASYTLQDPNEVKTFLKQLVEWKRRGGN